MEKKLHKRINEIRAKVRSVSKFFKDDLFCYASERRPPSHRWFGMGPARFGTAIYIDPLGTHAWNAVISGQRCWCLFPPDTPESLVKLKPGEGCEHRSEAIIWIIFVYPKIRRSDWP
ncbi:Bifunctional arginine demethylase and lysyl-hydroxylase JMJD6 [Trichinella pseudospiralis]|uniref:Bifunctional arginine demethylase and lysyl-hydroxylase JMJD6 n=1 Tax=Trichinella pseudospiralis TaxID=6337 RepID=A0A0V1FLV9_TRIPS|nr:Bifunctional arginine demethylase and lysyl-hydroxylase JMJD6 [Trichinella pseudospiralis]